MYKLTGLIVVFSAAIVCRPSASRGAITWNVAFNDPQGTYQSYDSEIQSTLLAAAAEWSTHLVSTVPSSMEIQVNFQSSNGRSSGHSVTSSFVTNVGGVNVYEQGAAYEIRTGIDPNGTAPDIDFDVDPTYLATQLWFDPNPAARTASVPNDRLDAYSVILHELTHALAFNGWRSGTDGSLPGNPPYESTFDRNETFDGTNLFFAGPMAELVYGGPVPITYGNNFHVGNNPPRPGAGLLGDLMNGVVYYYGARYDLSPLDLAMAADSGLAVVDFPPIPGDADFNGTVNFKDLLAVAHNYGRSGATWQMGDFDRDGVVDFTDLLILARHYGQSSVAPPATAAAAPLSDVPDPSAMPIFAIAAALLLRGRHPQRV